MHENSPDIHKIGFCTSYKNVRKFERNAAVSQGIDIIDPQGKFFQYAADNVDHQIRTLNGKNTFHGMGIILAATPEVKVIRKVPKQTITMKQILEIGQIKIHEYESNLSTSSFIFETNFNFEAKSKSCLELILKCSNFFNKDSSCLR